MSRTAARELTFQYIFSTEVTKDYTDENLDVYLENLEPLEKEVKEYIIKIVKGLDENKQKIEDLISENLSKKWIISRLPKIDLALLKLAVYEIIYDELPYKVAINEVVELAKKYSDDSSPSFINGALAGIIKAKDN